MMDASSIHPTLLSSLGAVHNSRHYYKACHQLKQSVRQTIVETYTPEHDVFLLSNTTHALYVLLLALQLEKMPVCVSPPINRHYQAYQPLLAKLPLATSGHERPRARFVTHVSPHSGYVEALHTSDKETLIVDAAQSFATRLHPLLIDNSDIFCAPLHKHAGLQIGQAILAIRRNHPFIEQCRDVLETAESGTQGLDRLRSLEQALSQGETRRFNTAQLNVSPVARAALSRHGIEIVSSEQAPFLCLRYSDVQGLHTLQACFESHKHFHQDKLIRYAPCYMAPDLKHVMDYSLDTHQKILEFFS